MRRQFDLPAADVEHLEARSQPWEAVAVDPGGRWVIVHDFPVPAGYNVNKVMAALRIEAGYPDTQIDMVYFCPALALLSGRSIGALSSEMMDGKQWQRWSRHRTAENPWRPGVDDLSTHLALVETWLARELKKG